jgi:chromosome segregation ATPase
MAMSGVPALEKTFQFSRNPYTEALSAGYAELCKAGSDRGKIRDAWETMLFKAGNIGRDEEMSSMKVAVDHLQGEISKKDFTITNLQKDNKFLSLQQGLTADELEHANAQLIKSDNEISRLKTGLSEATSHSECLMEQIRELKSKHAALLLQVERAQNECKERESKLSRLKKTVIRLEKDARFRETCPVSLKKIKYFDRQLAKLDLCFKTVEKFTADVMDARREWDRAYFKVHADFASEITKKNEEIDGWKDAHRDACYHAGVTEQYMRTVKEENSELKVKIKELQELVEEGPAKKHHKASYDP